MLRFILNPKDRWDADKTKNTNFTESLTDWGTLTVEYISQSGETLSENIKVSVVFEHAPEPYRTMLRGAPENVKATFASVRNHVRNYYNESRAFDDMVGNALYSGNDPMQVDAVKGKGKKGKSDGKGKKGDSKGGSLTSI